MQQGRIQARQRRTALVRGAIYPPPKKQVNTKNGKNDTFVTGTDASARMAGKHFSTTGNILPQFGQDKTRLALLLP